MNRKIIILIIIVLLFFNIFYNFKNVRQNAVIKELKQKINEFNKQQEMLAESLTYQKQMELRYDGSHINNQLLDTINFDIQLILRLNTRSCQKCIDHILLSLNKFNQEFFSRVIIIGTFETRSEFKYYTEYLLKNWRVINLENEYLMDNQLEYSAIPYFFTIDEDKKIHNLFVPDKNFPFITDAYLRNILSKLEGEKSL